MIAFEHKLAPVHVAYACEVNHCVSDAHRPTCIADDQEQILILPKLLPGIEYFLVVIAPVITKAIHRFTGAAREVHIAYSEDSHLSDDTTGEVLKR